MPQQYVPPEAFDTATGLLTIAAQMRALEDEREEIAAAYIEHMLTMFDDRRLDDLKYALEAFKLVYGNGYSKRATDAGLPDLQAVKRTILGQENDGPGRWRGDFPLAADAKRPVRGTWVVYQLLEADELLYIGSTSDLPTRLKAHARDKSFSAWRAAKCPSERACRDLETALIDRHRPPLNRMIPTPRVVLA